MNSPAFEPILGEHGSGSDGLHHLSPDEALRLLWILNLFANGDTKPPLDQASDVVLGRLDRNPCQRDVGSAAVVARRERKPKLTRRHLGVVEEHLVEIPHAEKQYRVAMPRLDLAILLHEGSIRRGRSAPSTAHRSSTTNGFPPNLRESSRTRRAASDRLAKRPTRTLRYPSSCTTRTRV